MTSRFLVIAALAALLAGCNSKSKSSAKSDELEPGELKVTLDQTPEPVRKTIQQQLVGAQLEDISKEQRNGKTIYETDIIRKDGKWEVVVAEDGTILSNVKEGSDEEKALDAKEKAEKKAKSQAQPDDFRKDFPVDKANLGATGGNPLLPVKPGSVVKMAHGKDTLTVTILNETRTIDGVECAILEERETKNGQLEEISRNYLATDKKTGDVYYFGEDVDNYKDGKVVSHDSAWHAGEKGAKFGMFMPAKPIKGDKFYQEMAPKEAMDRIEIISTDETVKTPAGTFEHCVHFKETTPLESEVSHKYFAPGIGMIKDDDFELAEKP
jgi:hypothetical protein